MKTFLTYIEQYPIIKLMLLLAGIFFLAWLSYFLVHRILIVLLKKAASKTKTKFDDFLVESKTLSRLSYIVPLLVIDNLLFLTPDIQLFVSHFSHILLIWIFILAASAFLGSVNSFYETKPKSKERPIKGYIQVAVIIIYIFGIIFIIGSLTGQSPWVLLSGVGAMTALVLLIFKDTILSFVAGIQITSYDLVHVGDWIEMRKFGADGDVIDIALHTIKVQNWDKTITVIPTYKIIDESFKNWRGMTAAGGRRIKRAVYIDLNSVAFCTEQMLDRFEKINLIKDYIKTKRKELTGLNLDDKNKSEVINKRRLTNIGTFRVYVEAYVKSHPKVHKSLTCMVRQLAPGPHGVPLEIYLFTNDIEWINYEAIQADIFDHIFAVVPEFGLRMYQQPSGQDMSRIQFIPSEI